MKIKNIIKRDGQIKQFHMENIMDCILSAYEEIYGENDKFLEDYDDLVNAISDELDEYSDRFSMEIEDETELLISVEEVQDIVIDVLSEFNPIVAEAYVDYRQERTFEREKNSFLDKEIQNVLDNKSEESTANANVDGSKIQTIRAIISNIVCRDFSRRHYIPRKFRKKQRKEIYIHDEYYFGLPFFNCQNTNWTNMFEKGFELGSTRIESPKSLESAINILTQVASHISSNTYGGTTFGNLVSGLAPYGKLSLEKYRTLASVWVVEEKREEFAWRMFERECEKSAQSLEYEVQTLMTSRGETPFLTIGLDCIDVNLDDETKRIEETITKAILNQRIKGLTDGVTPVFPKIVYHLEAGNNLYPSDPYYNLYKMAIRCSSLRSYPDYVMNEKTKEVTGSVKPPMGLISTSPCKILLTLTQEVCSL